MWNWGLTNGEYIGSGGGISTYYSIPVWQEGIRMTASGGSATYRNVPDVALTADNVYVTCDNGDGVSVGGTSCAAPMWAGFIALANQQAAAYHHPPVGFINPAVYAIGKGPSYEACFHNITTGDNTWSVSPNRFYAVSGYDLCTGWGTPNGQALINALAPLSLEPLVEAAGSALLAESCAPTNGAIDPGEIVTVGFRLQNLGGASTTNLVATLQGSGGVLSPSGPQWYGVLMSLGAPVTQPFSFTADGVCGGTITATLQLQDGAADLGSVSYTLPVGQAILRLSQDFDTVTAPALPPDWTTSFSGSGADWVTSTSISDTAPNCAFGAEPTLPGVGELVSPAIALPAAPAQLVFRQNYNMEADPTDTTEGYDGGVLEIKIGDGAFTDILAAGGSFVSGGYTRTIDVTDDNPLDGRQAWSGASGGWITTTVNLPAAATNQTIQLSGGSGPIRPTVTAAPVGISIRLRSRPATPAVRDSPVLTPLVIARRASGRPDEFLAVAQHRHGCDLAI